MTRLLLYAATLLILLPSTGRTADPAWTPSKGDRIAIVGDLIGERFAEFGHLETLLHLKYPEMELSTRSLARACDMPGEMPRALNFGDLNKHLTGVRADVVFACFGMAASFDGEAGLKKYEDDYRKLLQQLAAGKYNGKAAPKVVILGPIAHETIGGDFPDGAKHDPILKKYSEVSAKIAAEFKLPFVELFDATKALTADPKANRLTIDGIHPSDYGDWAVSHLIAQSLGFAPTSWVDGKPSGVLLPSPLAAGIHAGLQKYQPVARLKDAPAGISSMVIDGVASAMATQDQWKAGILVDGGPLANFAYKLHAAVLERNREFYYSYRAVNGEYIYGRRAAPFGVVNFPPEFAQMAKIIDDGDNRIHYLAKSPPKADKVAIETKSIPPVIWQPSPPKLTTAWEEYRQKPGEINGQKLATADSIEAALKSFKLPAGYEINLFASERDFPQLNKPLEIKFDAKGRCWVSTNPSYPHLVPGRTPNDQLLVLEDTKGAGRADKISVFADNLYMPLGFEFGDGGVYVSAQPNMIFLKDSDGDGKADIRRTVLHGLGTGDSHHAVHRLHYGPDGAIYFGDGTFHVTNIETPQGNLRLNDAGIVRFDPRTAEASAFVSYGFANPWGQVFDRYGQNFIADASGGANYFGLPITGHVDHPRKHPGMKVFTSTVRPTCGCELVYSKQFPDDAQGDYLVTNCIGFQGIKRHKVTDEGSGFTSKEMEPLLQSSDVSFRPVAITFGPDGALYIVDWYNPLVGHMQHSIRDPGRDHAHGRIWRITAKGRPLVIPPKVDGATVPALLSLLQTTYEDQSRYRIRRELRDRPKAEVLSALKTWIDSLREEAPALRDRMLLEALWVMQSHHSVDAGVLKRTLKSSDYRVRAGAVRVLRTEREKIELPLDYYAVAVRDTNPRVRLEAVVGLSFFRDARAAELALEVLNQPMDYYLEYGLKETMATLEPYWKAAIAAGKPFSSENPTGSNYILAGVPTADLLKMPRNLAVCAAMLSREGILAEQRNEALVALAKINRSEPLMELFQAIERADKHHAEGSTGGHVIHDLAQLLLARPMGELTTSRDLLKAFALKGNLAITRQTAYLAMMTADQSPDRVWTEYTTSVRGLRDVIDAVAVLPDAKIRAAAWSKVSPLRVALPGDVPRPNANTVTGRFVRVTVPGSSKTLSLAEVQVFVDGVNVAPRGKAKQSSTGFGGDPERAIDGNTNGDYAGNSVTHTVERTLDPWWEVDLGGEKNLESIVLWNRTNGEELAARLANYTLTVLDGSRKVGFEKKGNPAPAVNAKHTFSDNPAKGIRRAAMLASVSIPGHEADNFNVLAGFIRGNDEREGAIRAIRRIPKAAWPKEAVLPLVDAVIDTVRKLSAEERTDPAGLEAFQLGNDLISLLPSAKQKEVRAKLGDLGVSVVQIRTVPHRMAYDRPKFYVEAGKPAVLVFENLDIMPHNLVFGTPGSMAEIGLLAEKMALSPEGQLRQYVPQSPKVLGYTRLLSPGESQKLTFTAPSAPGDYTYLCTFPGHWRVMYGTMKVVSKLADVPPEELEAPPVSETSGAVTRPFVRNWTVEDLLPDLDKLDAGRNPARGRDLLKAGSCTNCHQMGNLEGGKLGPNYLELKAKLDAKKIDRRYVLNSIVHPSAEIEDKYATWNITKLSGGIVSGTILSEDKTTIRIQAGPNEKPIDVPVADIDEKVKSKVSMMPQGLLVTFTKDEILDVLAYLIAGRE